MRQSRLQRLGLHDLPCTWHVPRFCLIVCARSCDNLVGGNSQLLNATTPGPRVALSALLHACVKDPSENITRVGGKAHACRLLAPLMHDGLMQALHAAGAMPMPVPVPRMPGQPNATQCGTVLGC